MTIRTITAFALISAVALAGCATRPERIAAAPVATGCSADPAEDRAALEVLMKKQGNAATTDVVTTVLIGVPLSKLAGADHEKEIARLKACTGG